MAGCATGDGAVGIARGASCIYEPLDFSDESEPS